MLLTELLQEVKCNEMFESLKGLTVGRYSSFRLGVFIVKPENNIMKDVNLQTRL